MLLKSILARGAIVAGVVFSAWGAVASAQTPNPITLDLGQATANKGDTALVSVELQVGNTRPTNLVVWLRYDPTKVQPDLNAFEFTVVDLEGNPIRDGQGNVITSHGAVRREQVLIASNKQIDAEVHPEGAIGIAIQGLNNSTIAPGPMLTVAFKVQDGVAENEVVPIQGAEVIDPVQFTENGTLQTAFTTAHYQLPNDQQGDLGVEISDGRVVVPCTPPAAPTGVTATQGQADAVVVSWTAAAAAGAQYRVYRSKTNDVGTALPLSTGPQSATTFNDITAEGPVQPSAGCSCNAQATVVHYFYWVRTVSAAGCESDYSTPAADGFRGTAKAASAKAATVIDTLPAKSLGAGLNAAYAGQSIGVRLDDVAPATVWAEAASGNWSSAKTRWIADTANAGWAAIDLPATLAEGEHVLLIAGANGVGPIVREFVVQATAKSVSGLKVSDLGADAVPYLPEGVGSVYQIAPSGLFATPATVYLPVPAGEDAAGLVVYTYVADQGDRRWYLGANVRGWLAKAPAIEQINGQPHVRLDVRYGGIAQLGHAPAAGTLQQAGIAPASLARLHAGDLVLLALLSLAFLTGGVRARQS